MGENYLNKKGLIILLIIIIGVFGYKFIFQKSSYEGELVPVENATVALNEAIKNGKPTFVEFTSDSCPACKNAAPWIEEMYQTHKEEVNFILADVDRGGLSLAQQFGVRGVPTFVYFDKTGNIIEAFAGYPPTDSKQYLEDKLKVILE